MILAWISAASILCMILIVCVDVVARAFGHPLKGSYDLVRAAATLAIACGLPYTTACKGHVAIEYFFLKLNRAGRVGVDTLARLIVLGLFVFLAWECVQYGRSMKAANQLTMSLHMPEFWIPYVIAFCCAAVALVKIHNMLHPGKPMIKP